MPGKKTTSCSAFLGSELSEPRNSQTNPLVRKLMTHIEDKTENRSVQKQLNFSSGIGLVSHILVCKTWPEISQSSKMWDGVKQQAVRAQSIEKYTFIVLVSFEDTHCRCTCLFTPAVSIAYSFSVCGYFFCFITDGVSRRPPIFS